MLTHQMMGNLNAIQDSLNIKGLYCLFKGDVGYNCKDGCNGDCNSDCSGSCEGDCSGGCYDGCTSSDF